KQELEPRIGLLRPEPERGREPEQGREYRKRIDDVARPAPNALPEDRVEDRAHGQRQSLVVAEERKPQSDNGIGRPGMKAPMKDGRSHAEPTRRILLSGGPRQRRPAIRTTGIVRHRSGEMRNRLRNAVEHEPDPHARGEEHGEPPTVTVIGTRIPAAEPYAAVGGDDQRQAEQDENVPGKKEEPVEGGCESGPEPGEEGTRLFL